MVSIYTGPTLLPSPPSARPPVASIYHCCMWQKVAVIHEDFTRDVMERLQVRASKATPQNGRHPPFFTQVASSMLFK